MNTQELLRDLMDLAPAINDRVSEQTSSSMISDADPQEIAKNLIIEAVTLLVDLLHDCGISFYVDNETLFANRHNIGYIMSLYRQYEPKHIEQFLNTSETLCQYISNDVAEASDEEFIVKMLEAVRDINPTQYNNDMYSFLHDKVCSSRKYTSVIMDILHNRNMVADYDKPVDVTKDTVEFLVKLIAERNWHINQMLSLSSKGILTVDHHECLWLTSQFCSAYSLPANATFLSNYTELVSTNKEFIDKFINSIKKQSEYYVEHYSDEQISELHQGMIASIILAQMSDWRLFGITPDYKRLIANTNNNIFINDIIKAIPIVNKL